MEKIQRLHRIYRYYEEIVAEYAIICQKECAHCCTRNVTLTRLEGRDLFNHIRALKASRQTILVQKLIQGYPAERFHPQVTLNQMAEKMLQKERLPEEVVDSSWRPCPWLEEDVCAVYPARPFACRCLVSLEDCGAEGAARLPSYLLTVNQVFIQFIEHLDIPGVMGNLTNLMGDLLQRESDFAERCVEIKNASRNRLLPNRQIPMLLVPKAHQEQIRPVLEVLNQLVTA